MSMRVFNPGDVLNAADVNEYLVNTRFAVKPNDTTRISTATLANDPDLSLAVDANKSYLLECFLDYSSGATPNFKTAFTVPASTTFTGHIIAVAIGASAASITTLNPGAAGQITSAQQIAGLAFDGAVRYSGILTTGATAGTLTLQWAQNTNTASNTIVRAGSSLLLHRVA